MLWKGHRRSTFIFCELLCLCSCEVQSPLTEELHKKKGTRTILLVIVPCVCGSSFESYDMRSALVHRVGCGHENAVSEPVEVRV